MSRLLTCLIISVLWLFACQDQASSDTDAEVSLRIEMDTEAGTLSIFREGETKALVTQNAKPDFRPYLHPIMSPDGKNSLTEYSPGHHKHQTGLYWGFTRVNGQGAPKDTLKKWFYKPDKPAEISAAIGRDFFHHPEGDHWKRKSVSIIDTVGAAVSWQTVYEMLDESGGAILEETQTWTMREQGGKFFLELDWQGKALEDITINEFDYGGLFLRMPWKKGIEGQAVNAARQRNEKAEGQRAMWVDVGMEMEGRENQGHIAIFDHPQNSGFPQNWRVDGQLGIGPVRARMGDWQIKKGMTEQIQHLILAYTGDIGDLEMKAVFDEYSGEGSMYSTASLWGIAQAEGRAAKFLNPEEAVASMTMREGFQANAWAAEPMVTQPMAFCWDDRGRMWVAENRDYESRGTGFSNSGDSRIVILEDTDHDGVADSRKVFLEGIPFPSAIAVGFDGLYLGAPPNLLFVPDANQDDVAEEADIKVLLTGWGIRDRHETINSFHWGPDGWLYGLEGFATPSKIRKPVGKGRIYRHREAFPEDLLEADGVDIDGGVWRYHPTKDRFEVVSHGFSNPWGIDHDAKGQLFITACVIPHMFHVIPGGIYHRQGGQHFNPYVYSDIQTIVDHRHRSAHGGARIYQSDAFPAAHQGRLFMANIHEHAVLSDILSPNGSGFTASHGEDFLLANNAQWIGFSMEVGPGGDLFVLDWHDADICGKEVVNKETGRIFRISPTESQATDWPGRYGDLTQLSDAALAELQTSPSDWHARRARVILQYRASKGAIEKEALATLREIYQGTAADHRLRAMWTLHITGGFDSGEWTAALKDKDPYVRAWAIQLLTEDHNASEDVINIFAQLAKSDKSPVVRLYLAAALQRIATKDRWALAEGLLTHAEDIEDPNIPLMIWYGIEPLVADQPERGMALAKTSKLPQITNFIARRLIDAEELPELIKGVGERSSAQISLLEGMRDGLQGQSNIASAPPQWEAVANSLKKNPKTAELALEVSQLLGDAAAANQYLKTLSDPSSAPEKRRNALRALAIRQFPDLEAELPDLLDDPELRLEAIRAVAAYDNWRLGNQLLNQYPDFTDAEQQEALQTMASRSRYGRQLTDALKDGRIKKAEVPAYVARQLRRVVGNGFVEVWGPIDPLANDKSASYAKYNKLLTSDRVAQADLAKGAAQFQQTCGACHQLYGEGGNIGPDLTGSNRNNLEYLLSNILEPSGVIQDDYKLEVITTRDGRTYAGNIAAETPRQVTLRVVGQDEVLISKADIQSRETTEVSMMPEGLLEGLNEQQVVDLVGYLRGVEG